MNSQNLPSTPDEEDVVTASIVPAASPGTTSPQGSWTETMPSRLNMSETDFWVVRTLTPWMSSIDCTLTLLCRYWRGQGTT